MGSIRLDLRTPPQNRKKIIDQFYEAAFSPSLALYRQISLCGWRLRNNCDDWHAFSSHASAKSPKNNDIEVYETPNGMTIRVTLSNIKEDSLYLSITGKTVLIRGERIVAGKHASTRALSREQIPQFRHQIELPMAVRTGGFRAQLKGDIVQIDFARRKDY